MDIRKFMSKAGDKIGKKHQMNVFAVRTADPDGIVTKVGLKFQKVGPLTHEQLRCVLVGSIEELLTAINSHPKITPQLDHHPFTVEDIEVVIFIIDDRGAGLSAPDLVIGNTRRNKLIYSTMDRTGQYDEIVEVAQEPYSTALEIVKQGGCKEAP
jgi:hypothetical protein